MKTLAVALTLFAAAGTTFVCQQSGSQTGGRGRGGERPRDPFLLLFDTNTDDQISETEIKAASDVLRKLDQNGDGSLDRHELPRPPRPEDRGEQRDDGTRERGPRDEAGRERQRPEMEVDLSDAEPGTVGFRDGYQTDRRDGGRPVALIAAALGVKAQVFRDAFSNVQPSRSGPPSAARAHANKQVLMAALGKYGVTNDRLDEVSNYYRYKPQDGELWRVEKAQATAVMQDGKVTGFTITKAGSGYISAPQIVVAGHPNVRARATIEFSRDMKQNGRITKIELLED